MKANQQKPLMIGKCKLCGNERALCKSHAIPDAHFKQILRQSAGKAVSITDDEVTPIQYTNDSWHTYMLCAKCESLLNKRYDEYGIKVLRDDSIKNRRSEIGVTFKDLDRQRLRMFFLSVLWRISVSQHSCYGNINLPYLLEDKLHHALLNNLNVPDSVFTVFISKLHSFTGISALTEENLRGNSMTPEEFPGDGFKAIFYLCFGFIIEITFPRPPKKYLKKFGRLSGDCKTLMAPYWEALNFPPLKSSIECSIQNHDAGISRVPLIKNSCPNENMQKSSCFSESLHLRN